jgi:nucleotide sugar dehydrogenase
VSIIGIGRLGLSFSLVLEKAGFEVLGVDLDPGYVRLLNEKKFQTTEPEVETCLRSATRFRATTHLREAFEFSDLIFTFVATPSKKDHGFDHSQVEKILEAYTGSQTSKHFVIGCTVMPKTLDELSRKFHEKNIVLSYNPSFIAQGSILEGIQKPDFVLIGEGSPEAGDELEKVYKKICLNDPPIHRMKPLSAEITKLSLNCFITAKITYANFIGDLAQRVDAEPQKILRAIGSDSRVGEKYFQWGYGFGGPCFPRDNRALSKFAEDVGLFPALPLATERGNFLHLEEQVRAFEKENTKETRVKLGPVSYNGKTISIEESQQLAFAVCLAKKGYLITIVDRAEVLKLVRENYGDLFEYQAVPEGTEEGKTSCHKMQCWSQEQADSSEAIL